MDCTSGLGAPERRKRLTCATDTCFTMVSFLAYFSFLKMEAIYSPETSVKFQWTTRLLVKKFSAFCETRMLIAVFT
jgi:hypothetical protein